MSQSNFGQLSDGPTWDQSEDTLQPCVLSLQYGSCSQNEKGRRVPEQTPLLLSSRLRANHRKTEVKSLHALGGAFALWPQGNMQLCLCVFVATTLCFYEHLRITRESTQFSKYCSMKERSVTSTWIDLSVESTGSRSCSIKNHTVLNSHSLCIKLPCSEHRRAVYLLEHANHVVRAKAAALIQDIYIYI